MPETRWVLRLVLVVLMFATHAALAEEGGELFQKKCAGCHSIGGGDKVGPDLKGIGARRTHEWLVRVIAEPDRLTAENDPIQTALVAKYHMEMPNLGVSRDDAAKLAAFLSAAAAAAPSAAPSPGAAPAPKNKEAAAPPQLPATGSALFTGARSFAKGGAPCCGCHRLNYAGIRGGTLAGDLTGLYAQMGEEGVKGVLSSLQFPVMRTIFAERPLTDDERSALTALFKDAAGRREPPARPLFPWVGVGLFLLFLIGLAVYQRRG